MWVEWKIDGGAKPGSIGAFEVPEGLTPAAAIAEAARRLADDPRCEIAEWPYVEFQVLPG
jgi:hypothetical protein